MPQPAIITGGALDVMKKVMTRTAHTAAPHREMKLSLRMSDQTVESINDTHGHADHSFEVRPLLEIVQSIINRSTQAVDILKGTKVHGESTEEMTFKSPNINLPFCTLRAISCELSMGSCKLADAEVSEDVGHSTTLSILKKLSDYSWDAKAVLTLAAFALDYGEFWHLAQPHQSDHLAKPLSILKGVQVLLKTPADNLQSKRHRQVIAAHSLIKKTLQVIELIYKLEKLSDHAYSHKDVPQLETAMKDIPLAVYWAIRTTLACVTNITICITKHNEDKSGVNDLDLVINRSFKDLTNHLTNCKKQIVPLDTYALLQKLFHQTPFRINEVFRAMIFGKVIEQAIYIKAQTTVNVDELNGKKVLWFFSNVDISDGYINEVVLPNEEHRKEGIVDQQYRIVWIPIVYQWTDELKEKFNMLAKNKPWQVVRYFSSTVAGIKYIKDEWKFNDKPMVVVTNPHGTVEYRYNAISDQISIWEMILPKYVIITDWFRPLVKYIGTDMSTSMEEGKYILLYGGKDNSWIQEFDGKARSFLEEAKVEIKLVSMRNSQSQGEFWSHIQSLFVNIINNISTHHQVYNQLVTGEVQKLLWYKNIESGWAMLFKGWAVVTSGHGSTMLKVLEDFEKWKVQVAKNNFETAFQEYHNQVVKDSHLCHRFDIGNGTVKDIPNGIVKCPHCSRVMGIYLSFQCCHGRDEMTLPISYIEENP